MEEQLDVISPAEEFDRGAARRALDDLFANARQYRSSRVFKELLDFVAEFRFYSPFNAMLIHAQMKGAKYVAPARRWLREFGREIKPHAQPLVILQPMGPVMFVFDVADTDPLPNAPPLPHEVEHPFEVRRGTIGPELEATVENAIRDGIRVVERPAGSQSAGTIQVVSGENYQHFPIQKKGAEPLIIPIQYELLLNSRMSAEARYATLVHELAHLYCGHLGTPNESWWPDRRGSGKSVEEFEAESVCYLVCKRLGIDNPSEQYLAGYILKNDEIPPISLDRVMKAAGLIEKMGHERLKARKSTPPPEGGLLSRSSKSFPVSH
jgi:hypothetical protein